MKRVIHHNHAGFILGCMFDLKLKIRGPHRLCPSLPRDARASAEASGKWQMVFRLMMPYLGLENQTPKVGLVHGETSLLGQEATQERPILGPTLDRDLLGPTLDRDLI